MHICMYMHEYVCACMHEHCVEQWLAITFSRLKKEPIKIKKEGYCWVADEQCLRAESW